MKIGMIHVVASCGRPEFEQSELLRNTRFSPELTTEYPIQIGLSLESILILKPSWSVCFVRGNEGAGGITQRIMLA